MAKSTQPKSPKPRAEFEDAFHRREAEQGAVIEALLLAA